jgi:hypothetical protein
MIQFTRHDPNEPGSYETLTLVRLDSDRSLAIQVETGTPETWRKDPNDRTFVGLYDLDGDQLELGNENWEIAEDPTFNGAEADALAETLGLQRTGAPMPAATVLAGLLRSWESGTSVCEAAP